MKNLNSEEISNIYPIFFAYSSTFVAITLKLPRFHECHFLLVAYSNQGVLKCIFLRNPESELFCIGRITGVGGWGKAFNREQYETIQNDFIWKNFPHFIRLVYTSELQS